MTSRTMGEGERAEAARKRRAAMLFAISMAVAVAMVVGTAIFKQGHGRIAPGWAVAFVGLYLVAVFASWRFACRVSDEVELRNNVGALAAGGTAYALVYPAWYFLWRGGLVPEPIHEALFVVAFLTTMTAYLWKRYR
jgi:cation transport ATPase